ncbi:unnamed protein product, partial [Ranitomeya imitator]
SLKGKSEDAPEKATHDPAFSSYTAHHPSSGGEKQNQPSTRTIQMGIQRHTRAQSLTPTSVLHNHIQSGRLNMVTPSTISNSFKLAEVSSSHNSKDFVATEGNLCAPKNKDLLPDEDKNKTHMDLESNSNHFINNNENLRTKSSQPQRPPLLKTNCMDSDKGTNLPLVNNSCSVTEISPSVVLPNNNTMWSTSSSEPETPSHHGKVSLRISESCLRSSSPVVVPDDDDDEVFVKEHVLEAFVLPSPPPFPPPSLEDALLKERQEKTQNVSPDPIKKNLKEGWPAVSSERLSRSAVSPVPFLGRDDAGCVHSTHPGSLLPTIGPCAISCGDAASPQDIRTCCDLKRRAACPESQGRRERVTTHSGDGISLNPLHYAVTSGRCVFDAASLCSVKHAAFTARGHIPLHSRYPIQVEGLDKENGTVEPQTTNLPVNNFDPTQTEIPQFRRSSLESSHGSLQFPPTQDEITPCKALDISDSKISTYESNLSQASPSVMNPEDITSMELAKEIASKDKSLADILDPELKMKTTMDLMGGLFLKSTCAIRDTNRRWIKERILPERVNSTENEMTDTEKIPAGNGVRSSVYYSMSAPEVELLKRITDMHAGGAGAERLDVNEKKVKNGFQ